MTISEPAVTLTDYGLAVECAVFVCLLCRRKTERTRYFDHNALYHSIQAIALLLIYLSARGILRAEP